MLVSYSRLSLYSQCPWRFYQKYVLGKTEPQTKPLALGKAVHKAIELQIQGTGEKEAILQGIVEADFHPEVTSEEVESLLKRAPIIQGQTEVHFELPLAPESGIRFQGYIDLLQPAQLWDWKSNWRPYGANDTKQLALYAWAIMRMQEWEQVKGTLFFLRYRKPVSHVYTKLEAEEARQWAYQLAEEIGMKMEVVGAFPDMASTLFPSSPSSACKHCPFIKECFIQNHKIRNG